MDANCTTLIVPGQVDSLLKLRLLLRFHSHPQLALSAHHLSEWMRENPWEIVEALDELVDAELLARTASGEGAVYRLAPTQTHLGALVRLVDCFDDPERRDDLYERVRAAARERQFRSCLALEAGAGGFYAKFE
jgi:hypothetical protein